MHLFIFLNLADEFLEVFYIDEIICTKFPTVEIDLIGKFIRILILVMLHGPCKKINFHSPCMSNAQDSSARYTKHYLYNFFKKTFVQKNGYLLYCQCNNSFMYKISYPQDRN